MRALGFVFFVLAAHLSATMVSAQTPIGADTSKADKKATPKWKTYCDLSARLYSVGIQGQPNLKVVRSDEPIFVHTIQIGIDGKGIVYLWTTEKGRPVAVITSMLHQERGSATWDEGNELHSLYESPIFAQRKGQKIWQPRQGIRWHELEDAPKPSTSKSGQLLQAKSLARKFKAKAVYRRADGKEWKLRLLPTPVHQYADAGKKGEFSGFLFVFCRSNDPELFLQLEVKKDEDGKARWTCACASFTDAGVTLELNNAEFWSEDPPIFSSRYVHWGFAANQTFDLDNALRQLQTEIAAD